MSPSSSSTLETIKSKFQNLNCDHGDDMTQIPLHFKSLPFKIDPTKILANHLVKCAVLVVLFKTNNQFNVLWTIRGFEMKTYPGEICFPGGKFDPEMDTDLRETAFREAQEEIGLERNQFEFICQTCPYISPVGHYILPVVVLLKNPSTNDFEETLDVVKSLKVSSNEVESIFWTPLDDYILNPTLAGDVYTVEEIQLDEDQVRLMRKFSQIPRINRIFVNFNERMFQNNVLPTLPLVYGINATILLHVALTVCEKSEFRLELTNGECIRVDTIQSYVDSFRAMVFYMCLVNRMIKSYEKKVLAKL